jgi:CheY-like chemotaxis protein
MMEVAPRLPRQLLRTGFISDGAGGINKSMKPLRVLVAEDDTMIGMLLGEVLTGMGYDVCAIEATQADTVAAAVRHRPDMMIVDAWLGDGSGITAVEEVLRSGFVPHVFVSGDTLAVQARCPGAVVLQKPFREADLAQAIQRALTTAPPSPGKATACRSVTTMMVVDNVPRR